MEHNEFCPYCDHFIEEGMDPIINFPCLHRAHTTCFLQLLNNESHSLAEQYRRCQFCEVTLFETDRETNTEEEIVTGEEEAGEEETGEEEAGEEEAEDAHVEGYIENEVVDNQEPDDNLTSTERIRKQVLENKQLQLEIKAFIKAKRACGPKRAALKKFIREKRNEIKHSVDFYREQLESLLRSQKNLIRQSPFFRAYQGAIFKIFMMRARIKTRYNLSTSSLRRALHNEPGFRQLTRDPSYHSSASYVLRRAFNRRCIRY
jgi:hypothetical protein